MAVSASERRYLLDQVDRLARADLNNLWAVAEQLETGAFFDYILSGFPELASNYHQVAATVAATWFEQSDPQSAFIARPADPVDEARIVGSTRWALGGDGVIGRERLEGVLQRAVFDGARDTVIVNAEASGSTWIRVARPDACAFCRLLATRTDYTSRAAATTVVSARKRTKRRLGDKYHDHCYCQPVEVRADQTVADVLGRDGANQVDQWNDEYLKARANAGVGDAKQILAAWRQQGAD